MSFQAMAWAIKQKAGDSGCRLLLLVLSNYADEDYRAWPSQTLLDNVARLVEISR